MAFNQIPVSPSTTWGQLALAYRQQLIAQRQQEAACKLAGAYLLGKLSAMKQELPDRSLDFTRLEQQLGLQTGQGALLYDQVNSCVGNFRDSNDRAAVNAAVDQFINFIG